MSPLKSANSISPPRWHLFPDADAVARDAAARLLRAADEAIRTHGRFCIALAGGHTPEKAYALLGRAQSDWDRWQIYFGDERCLPRDDIGRNSHMTARVWLDQVSIPQNNVHPIPAEKGAETAADFYGDLIRPVLPFDLVLLGIGEDGHTASLFPGHRYPEDALAHAVHNAPKPPPERVTLSKQALSNARQVLVVATGANKRNAVKAWKRGHDLPVAKIQGLNGIDVLMDQDAAG